MNGFGSTTLFSNARPYFFTLSFFVAGSRTKSKGLSTSVFLL